MVFDLYTQVLLAFPEHLHLINRGEVREPGFSQLACLFQCLRCSNVILIALETHQLRVDQRVIDVPMSQELFDVEDVFGSVVFCRGFPVSERVETDVQESRVLEFER